MYDYGQIDEHVKRMRAMGEILVSYNFPKVKPEEEDAVSVLKERDIVADGYDLCCHYSKSDYGEYLMEMVQVFGRNTPFLPFCLVCKLGRKFLGDKHLSLVEIYRHNRKMYCWTVAVDRDGKPIPSPFQETKYEDHEFQGFRYRLMNPKTVNFY